MEGFLVKRLQWIPVMMVVVLSMGTLISFLIAFFREDVSVYLPFISETGGEPPESCVFTLGLILGSFFGTVIVLIRYLIVAEDANAEEYLLALNTKAMYVGYVSMLGIAIVAAFPMKILLSVHLIGAGTHFVLGVIYICLQTYINFRLKGKDGRNMFMLRLILVVITVVSLTIMSTTYPIGHFVWRKSSHDHDRSRKIPEDQGFGVLLTSSFFEWVMCTSFLSYFVTFCVEFRNYHWVANIKRTSPEKTLA